MITIIQLEKQEKKRMKKIINVEFKVAEGHSKGNNQQAIGEIGPEFGKDIR